MKIRNIKAMKENINRGIENQYEMYCLYKKLLKEMKFNVEHLSDYENALFYNVMENKEQLIDKTFNGILFRTNDTGRIISEIQALCARWSGYYEEKIQKMN